MRVAEFVVYRCSLGTSNDAFLLQAPRRALVSWIRLDAREIRVSLSVSLSVVCLLVNSKLDARLPSWQLQLDSEYITPSSSSELQRVRVDGIDGKSKGFYLLPGSSPSAFPSRPSIYLYLRPLSSVNQSTNPLPNFLAALHQREARGSETRK